MKGIKYDEEKLDWSLFPFEALKETVRVLMHGAKKYDRNNWKFVKPKERYFSALIRHLTAWQSGEKLDKESGLSHLSHALCCLIFLVWHEQNTG